MKRCRLDLLLALLLIVLFTELLLVIAVAWTAFFHQHQLQLELASELASSYKPRRCPFLSSVWSGLFQGPGVVDLRCCDLR